MHRCHIQETQGWLSRLELLNSENSKGGSFPRKPRSPLPLLWWRLTVTQQLLSHPCSCTWFELKCPPQVPVFGHSGPSWWCYYSGSLWNPWEVELHWRKWVTALCFLTSAMVWSAASHSCRRAFLGMDCVASNCQPKETFPALNVFSSGIWPQWSVIITHKILVCAVATHLE